MTGSQRQHSPQWLQVPVAGTDWEGFIIIPQCTGLNKFPYALLVIRLTPEYPERPVHLLDKKEPGHGMGKSHF